MALSIDKQKEYMKRLLLSRLRILMNHGFYGLLLINMKYAIYENCETAATDGDKIYFGTKFMDELSDPELDFVLMHEILHVVLRHCIREDDRDHTTFNIACDIVVNSNILFSNKMNLNSITLRKYGESLHRTPDGKEGFQFTAEEVYEMLKKRKMNLSVGDSWDDHSKWKEDNDDYQSAKWEQKLVDACQAIGTRGGGGKIPLCAERILKELTIPQTDWRTVLNDFVQEEIVDYSFSPPDRRFDDSLFFLPDLNEKDDSVKDILFMIDTSGSMSKHAITIAYSEIKSAIEQFNEKLKGWLGFFNAMVVEPKPFSNVEEFNVIRVKGGGGTSFDVIFEYVGKHIQSHEIACIIILTDGYAPFPDEKVALGIPVLWLINNDNVTPPWGRISRIKIDE